MSPAEPFFSARINGPPKIELLIIFCQSSYKYFLKPLSAVIFFAIEAHVSSSVWSLPCLKYQESGGIWK